MAAVLNVPNRLFLFNPRRNGIYTTIIYVTIKLSINNVTFFMNKLFVNDVVYSACCYSSRPILNLLNSFINILSITHV